jgi:hypothetical protein
MLLVLRRTIVDGKTTRHRIPGIESLPSMSSSLLGVQGWVSDPV